MSEDVNKEEMDLPLLSNVHVANSLALINDSPSDN